MDVPITKCTVCPMINRTHPPDLSPSPPVCLSPSQAADMSGKGKMDEYSYEEESGLELLHVSDVLDYLGNFPPVFSYVWQVKVMAKQ